MGFSILKVSSYKKRMLNPDKAKFDIDRWRLVVNSDPELTWMEDSPLAAEYRKINESLVPGNRLFHNCYYEINKLFGYGNIRMYFFEDNIGIECERQTLKRIEKMWEIAQKLDGYLFKNGTRFTEKKLLALREKYNKNKIGDKAPSDK